MENYWQSNLEIQNKIILLQYISAGTDQLYFSACENSTKATASQARVDIKDNSTNNLIREFWDRNKSKIQHNKLTN